MPAPLTSPGRRSLVNTDPGVGTEHPVLSPFECATCIASQLRTE